MVQNTGTHAFPLKVLRLEKAMCGSGERSVILPGAAMAALFSDQGLSGYVSFETQNSGNVEINVLPTLPIQASALRIHQYGRCLNERTNNVLYQYPLARKGTQLSCYVPLSISADEKGIVGRGISISDSAGETLCNGVIGWN